MCALCVVRCRPNPRQCSRCRRCGHGRGRGNRVRMRKRHRTLPTLTHFLPLRSRIASQRPQIQPVGSCSVSTISGILKYCTFNSIPFYGIRMPPFHTLIPYSYNYMELILFDFIFFCFFRVQAQTLQLLFEISASLGSLKWIRFTISWVVDGRIFGLLSLFTDI